ncbi:MAG: SpoIIE family protein phosphatase [Chloroflexus sp.]|nr:SpoIIE family protein phosphatase [Chloroflexus sp.]MBO9318898.1 SpoIIE family protein phosphatase [Chloroflexus sp.]MBO9372839.1 SpoIIE family protein phosphatase [Chloroflexus sp.]
MQRQTSVFADWNAIPTLLAFSDALEADWQLSHDYVYLLRLVIEEVATNIIKYGYDDHNRDQIQLFCQYEQGTLTITIRDRGRAFDPRDAPPPDLSSVVDQRAVGGLGLFFVREYADSLDYRHDPTSGWNELVITKTMTMLDRLRSLPLFQVVPEAVLAELVPRLAECRLAAGEVLFHQGDPGNECFVILSGAVEVITFVNGAELRLEVFQAGQIIGEMSLIDHSPRSATVRAIEPSRLVGLNETVFATLISSSPALAMNMLRSIVSRVRNTNLRMIHDLERKNAELLTAYQQLQAAQAELIRLNRLEEELDIARRIQQSFLPRVLPQPSGWRIAGFSRGAQAVGGDFYDTITLPDGRIGLVVADACGKGVTAALFVALSRSLLRAASQAVDLPQRHSNDSAAVLRHAVSLTNDYICREHGEANMFITLFYGLLDPESGLMTYINAGHNPPLRIRCNGELIEELHEGSLPIGIIAAQTYDVHELQIDPGEKLVAFSDGITEAMNPAGELFGDERLQTYLRTYAHQSAADLVTGLVAAVETFAAGALQADDITLLIVERLPVNSV